MIKLYFNVKISISYYQNEDEPHALVSHAINQGRQSLKVFVQDKVKLTLHVVNVCILHILEQTAIQAQMNRCLTNFEQPATCSPECTLYSEWIQLTFI